ncbi:MAG: DUF3750 domain-containing protein [Gammaproteobacteria bacterium]|nr:DUF3750 domain-containing protein [Gammaproteobacteria bacterium]
MKTSHKICAGLLVLSLLGPALVACNGAVKFGQDWRTADRSPAGIAPDPRTAQEAIVQVYSARAFNWRGLFAVHTWVATKHRDADSYTVHQVVGWNRYDDMPAVESERDAPDRSWYGQPPVILAELRGPEAEAAIDRIAAAVASYPYPRDYVLWPGPNSNTFTAWIARRVPALRLDLPPTAIGKDFLGGEFIDRAPSGTGYQFSLFGLLGLTVAGVEGLEINVLGAALGLNPFALKLRLPGLGILQPG